MMSGSGRPEYSASGFESRTARYSIESVVLAAPPSTDTPFLCSAAARARAAYQFGSGRAKLSIQRARPSAAVPAAQIAMVPGVRKKLSPIVEPESAGPVRARFSKAKSGRSGFQVIVGG